MLFATGAKMHLFQEIMKILGHLLSNGVGPPQDPLPFWGRTPSGSGSHFLAEPPPRLGAAQRKLGRKGRGRGGVAVCVVLRGVWLGRHKRGPNFRHFIWKKNVKKSLLAISRVGKEKMLVQLLLDHLGGGEKSTRQSWGEGSGGHSAKAG